MDDLLLQVAKLLEDAAVAYVTGAPLDEQWFDKTMEVLQEVASASQPT